MSDDIKNFVRERNAALLAGGQAFQDFIKKHKIKMPSNHEVVERARLKAITACTDISVEERQAAKDELNKRNSSSWDDGELT